MEADPQTWTRDTLSGAEITVLRTRPWADVWRVDAADGRWWLKVNKALTTYEPRLLAVLAADGAGLLPEAIVHPDRPWALVRDAGQSVREALPGDDQDAVLAFWEQLLAAYAELQRAVDPAALRAAGVPETGPDRLVAEFDALLADRRWFTREANPELDEAELARIAGCRPALVAAVDQLADAIAPALQHDDLHEGNVFLDGDRPMIIDWGDAVLSHPFSTMRVTLDVLAAVLELPADGPELARVRDAYLEPWRVAGESRTELLRQCDLAIRTGGLVRALGWARALGSPEAGVELGFADGPSGWLQRLADDL